MATVAVSNNVGDISRVYPCYRAQKRAQRSLTFTYAAAKTRFSGKLSGEPGGLAVGLGNECAGKLDGSGINKVLSHDNILQCGFISLTG